jgi:hypothetical protein
MRALRRFSLANNEVVYSVEGFGENCVVVYCEREDDKWKVSKGTLTNGNISDYGLAIKHIVTLEKVRSEKEACNLAEFVLTDEDLPEFDTEEVLKRITDADDIDDMVAE